MAESHFPYTYYSCPCVDTSAPITALTSNRKNSREGPPPVSADDDDEEQNFDPKSPRANLSLVPLEYLLWCTECHQVRCSRCTIEEVVCWYCPTCLFEVPSSTVRSEGNRCTRNCYNCPICTSPLTVNPLDEVTDEVKSDTPAGPFIIMCGWCNWSSLEIGVKLEKHNNLTSQLNKIKAARRSGKKAKPQDTKASDEEDDESDGEEGRGSLASTNPPVPDEDELFSRLSTFYRQQINESSETPLFGSYAASDLNFSSPSAISRILNIYSGKKTKRSKPKPMREALDLAEGLVTIDPDSPDTEILKQLETGWDGTTDQTQRAFQPGTQVRYTSDLWPVPSLLRTKRAKRCKTCRTLLARPEPRMTSSRWRIRVLALNNIPKISLRALSAPQQNGPYTGAPLPPGITLFDYEKLDPGRPYQFLLTVANPLFDPISVTLATPTRTPGRVTTKVTILCPQFVVGANSDAWDEALGGGSSATSGAATGGSSAISASSKRRSLMPGSMPGVLSPAEEDGARQAEAGKIWGKGRNWTSVIVEVVPGALPPADDLEADEDVLEIAVFVRLEYETEAAADDKPGSAAGAKEKREEAFWCVLGAGQIKPFM